MNEIPFIFTKTYDFMKINSVPILLSLLGSFLLFFSSCDKSNQGLPYDNINDFFFNKGPKTQTFSFDPGYAQTITGTDGTIIKFLPNSFNDASGNLITTTVVLEMKEILTKGDMIWADLPTDCYSEVLESGGEFYLNASSNGTKVFLNQDFQMIVPVSSATVNTDSMQLFIQAMPVPDSPVWVPAVPIVPVNLDVSQTNYDFYFNSLEWINVDVFWGTSLARVDLPINVNTSINQALNTRVYVVFKDINSVLRGSLRSLNEYMIYSVPEGQEVSIVVVSMDEEQFYFGIKETITGSTPVSIEINPVSEGEIEAAINGF